MSLESPGWSVRVSPPDAPTVTPELMTTHLHPPLPMDSFVLLRRLSTGASASLSLSESLSEEVPGAGCHASCSVVSTQKRGFQDLTQSDRFSRGPAIRAPSATAWPAASSTGSINRVGRVWPGNLVGISLKAVFLIPQKDLHRSTYQDLILAMLDDAAVLVLLKLFSLGFLGMVGSSGIVVTVHASQCMHHDVPIVRFPHLPTAQCQRQRIPKQRGRSASALPRKLQQPCTFFVRAQTQPSTSIAPTYQTMHGQGLVPTTSCLGSSTHTWRFETDMRWCYMYYTMHVLRAARTTRTP